MDLLLYQFVDEQLFRISALFNTDHFPAISDALVKKYGQATSEKSNPRRLIWENLASTIELTIGTVRPKRPSTLHFIHTDLAKTAHSREPDQAADI